MRFCTVVNLCKATALIAWGEHLLLPQCCSNKPLSKGQASWHAMPQEHLAIHLLSGHMPQQNAATLLLLECYSEEIMFQHPDSRLLLQDEDMHKVRVASTVVLFAWCRKDRQCSQPPAACDVPDCQAPETSGVTGKAWCLHRWSTSTRSFTFPTGANASSCVVITSCTCSLSETMAW